MDRMHRIKTQSLIYFLILFILSIPASFFFVSN
jgi:hypothetical protein